MASETLKVMVEGGKATAAPPLGPALGPTGLNIGQVISTINQKTASFKGMQVPVTVSFDRKNKTFEVEIGTPPASALLKNEAGIEKGSGNPKADKVADVLIEQIIKVAKMKEGNLLGKTMHDRVKEIIGTCNSMGILVEGVPAVDAIKLVNEGKFNKEIAAEKTELTAEEKKHLEAEKKRLAEEAVKRRADLEKAAQDIIAQNPGADKPVLKAKMKAANLPDDIIKQFLPSEGDKAAAPGAAPAAGAKAAAPAKK